MRGGDEQRGIGYALHGGYHHWHVLRQAARHGAIGRDVFDSRYAVTGEDGAEFFVWVSLQIIEDRAHRLFRRREHRQTIRPLVRVGEFGEVFESVDSV